MSRLLPHLGRRIAAVLALVLAAPTAGALTGAGLDTASANTAGPGLVINEVYGGGGNSGATLKNDFIELRNTGTSAVSLGGLSLQYRSATGSGAPGTSNVFALPSVDLPSGQTYLIGAAAGTGGTQDLPTPDTTSTLALGGTGGQVFLANGTSPVDPGSGQINNSAVTDFVGWGASTTSYEGATGPAPATTNAQSVSRNSSGADTNDNAADLTAGAPTPTACGSACSSTPPACSGTKTIAQIQGTDTDTSPCVGSTVTTTGTVTAVYATGGFYGYVLQTDGTGGSTPDATPGASDGVFVYQPSGTVTATIGHSLTVTGAVSEYQGLTELAVPTSGVVDHGMAPIGVQPLAIAYPTTDVGREAHESELLAPTNQFTVTDNYSTNQYGEIGLATGDHQLVQPTDVYPWDDQAHIQAVIADNAARKVTLDDGKSTNFLTSPGNNTAMSWITPDNPVRIGSRATLHQPVILDYRNSLWKLQPTGPVSGAGGDVATFSDTRAANLQPANVGGNLKLGTFNVLNYFNTTGADWVAAGHTCTFYDDRTGDPVTDNTCSDNGPRGAAESSGGTDLSAPTADLERQRAKEVKAINLMNPDVLSLEEIENSVALGETDRDDALKSLVNALNAAAGYTRWAYVPSPPASALPPLAEQDVIRTAFIYNPNTVELVGGSTVLSDQSGPGQPFENAREPLAQEFKRKGAKDKDGFLVIVNHFKSKGSGVDDGRGQGLSNPDRIAQAKAVVTFAQQMATAHATDRVFLVGDFNSYTQEDPMQVLYGAGYVNQASDDPRDVSYEFGGLAGSLDHVLANAAAAKLVTGRDVWQINAEESVGFEYSRYNYNATQLYQANQFRASDHNPEIVGLDAPYTKTVTHTHLTPVTVRYGARAHTTVTVKAKDGSTPTGTVTVRAHGKKLGRATLSNGSATVRFRDRLKPGRYVMKAYYSGDNAHAKSQGGAKLVVRHLGAHLRVGHHPRHVRAHHRWKLTVRVAHAGRAVDGRVVVRTGGLKYSGLLRHGKVVFTVRPYASAGKKKVVVRYLGTKVHAHEKLVTHLKVKRR